MVCLDDGIICVPKNSLSGDALCLRGVLRCNGEQDCADGADEKGCGNEALLSPGIQALIAIGVIAVVVLIPVLYVVIQKRRGKPVLPACLQPVLGRLDCFKSDSSFDRSSQELTSAQNTSTSSEKDGFTNVAFETSKYNSTGSQHLDRFRRQQEADDKLPSYREWQTARLQPQPANGVVASSPPNGDSHNRRETNNVPPRPYYQDRMQPNAAIDPGPVRYASSTARADNANKQSHNPYAISTTDGRAKYEARSHLQGRSPNQQQQPDENSRPAVAPWDSSASRPGQRYSGQPGYVESRNRYNAPRYTNQDSGAVPPEELRYALERVSTSSSTPRAYYRSPVSPSVPPTHSADDTVV